MIYSTSSNVIVTDTRNKNTDGKKSCLCFLFSSLCRLEKKHDVAVEFLSVMGEDGFAVILFG